MAAHTYDRRPTETTAPVAGRRRFTGALLAIGAGSGITAGAAASVADLVPIHPDSVLIELGRQLTVGWRRMDDFLAYSPDKSDEGLDAVMDPIDAIVRCIEHSEARTFEGVQVKALAISWLNSGEEIDPDRFNPFPGATTDARIAASIVRDLLRVQA